MTTVRLRPSVEHFVGSDGALYFVRPGAADLVVRRPEDVDIRLLDCLKAEHHSPASLAAVVGIDEPAVLESKLNSLRAAGLLVERGEAASHARLDPEDEERFSRQLPYLSELGDDVDLQVRLRAARVVVIGCGGIGTWTVAALASIGVGSLVLVDDDTVDLTNLNRQVLYRRQDVGSPKVHLAAAWVRSYDPTVDVTASRSRVTGVAEARELVAAAEAVVLAADEPPFALARWVNEACVAEATPFVVAGQAPPVLKIGPTYAPGRGPCFACHETALRQESEAYDDYVASRAATAPPASTLGPASAVIGGLIALELMHLLSGQRPVTCDSAVLIDMRTFEARSEPVSRDPDCVVCRSAP